MLQNITELYGNKLAALDGDIGHIKDFYFDDKSWVIRYLVANTGSWLAGRLVLLSPHALGKRDSYEETLHVKLRKTQIENSPPLDAHRPVSRQYEAEYYHYYGWPAYWDGGGMWGFGGYPVVIPLSKAEMQADMQHHHRDDKHLRSMRAMTGFRVEAPDGPIGTVSGFLVDNKSWAIRKLVVETGHWYSGKEIPISPEMIERISYEESKVFVTLSKTNVLQTAALRVPAFSTGNFGREIFHD